MTKAEVLTMAEEVGGNTRSPIYKIAAWVLESSTDETAKDDVLANLVARMGPFRRVPRNRLFQQIQEMHSRLQEA